MMDFIAGWSPQELAAADQNMERVRSFVEAAIREAPTGTDTRDVAAFAAVILMVLLDSEGADEAQVQMMTLSALAMMATRLKKLEAAQ